MSGRLRAAASTLALAAIASLGADTPGKGPETKKVLVELFTSQGCDMCPKAEDLLGQIAAKGGPGSRVVPVAFHVDYFNDPWHDPFSSKAHSEREQAYNTVMKRTDLYFTPMMMVDGRTPMLGSNSPLAVRSIAAASDDAPGADLTLAWDGPASAGSRRLKVAFTPRAAAAGRATLVGVAVTEDPVATRVLSGENGGKTLVNRYAVRSFTFENVRIKAGESRTLTVPVRLVEGGVPENTAVAVFVQDWADGRIHQAESISWVDRADTAMRP